MFKGDRFHDRHMFDYPPTLRSKGPYLSPFSGHLISIHMYVASFFYSRPQRGWFFFLPADGVLHVNARVGASLYIRDHRLDITQVVPHLQFHVKLITVYSASMYSAAPDRTHIPPLSLSRDVSVHVCRT